MDVVHGDMPESITDSRDFNRLRVLLFQLRMKPDLAGLRRSLENKISQLWATLEQLPQESLRGGPLKGGQDLDQIFQIALEEASIIHSQKDFFSVKSDFAEGSRFDEQKMKTQPELENPGQVEFVVSPGLFKQQIVDWKPQEMTDCVKKIEVWCSPSTNEGE